MLRFLKKLRGLNFVFRWNFHPRQRQENVAEHSFWVAVYAGAIATKMGMKPEYVNQVMCIGLCHDFEEAITGDLPSLIKRFVPEWIRVELQAQAELYGPETQYFQELNNLGHIDEIVKAADALAALIYVDEELRMGNKYFVDIKAELIGLLHKRIAKSQSPEFRDALGSILDGFWFYHDNGQEMIKEMSHF